MHDPQVVAFRIPRPWPKRLSAYKGQAKGRLYFPPVITVWHTEPGGRDSGTVCKHYERIQLPNGEYKTKWKKAWKWHVHHWDIQIHPIQALRHKLLTRCAWCGGRDRKGDPVNMSHRWEPPKRSFWQGATHLYHHDCSSIANAHKSCVCDTPILEHNDWGRCAKCTLFRAYGKSDEAITRSRELQAIPVGKRERS